MFGSTKDTQPLAPDTSSWWLDRWKSYVAAALAVVVVICGLITALSISFHCIVAGALQVACALMVLVVEAPTFVSFLSFARPVGTFLEARANWIKAVVYTGLAIIPLIPGCWGVFFILGFLASFGIAAIFGMLVLGRKATREEMLQNAADGGEAGKPYVPTSA